MNFSSFYKYLDTPPYICLDIECSIIAMTIIIIIEMFNGFCDKSFLLKSIAYAFIYFNRKGNHCETTPPLQYVFQAMQENFLNIFIQ